MFILIVNIGPSPFNQSIWTGFAAAFQRLGHYVQVVDYKHIPHPASFPHPPSLFFAVHGGYITPESVRLYRDRGIPTAVYLLDEPYEVDRSRTWSQHYDWVFSVDKATVAVHGLKSNAVYLPLAYDDAIFHPEGPNIPSDILVLGSPFSTRAELLSPVVSRWGKRITWVGPGWRNVSADGKHFENYVTPDGCAQFYRGANVVINIHRDSFWSHFGELNKEKIAATHLNPRFWEAAGCGAFQICSLRDDLQAYAPETPTFINARELEDKLAEYLDNEPVRQNLAQSIYLKMKGHTYLRRTQNILELTRLK